MDSAEHLDKKLHLQVPTGDEQTLVTSQVGVFLGFRVR